MSKLQNKNTYIVGIAYSLYGFIETATLLFTINSYNSYINSKNPSVNNLQYFIISLFIIIGLNLLSLLIQAPKLSHDQKFSKWLKNKVNLTFYIIVSCLSAVLNYKFKMILFSKLFSFLCMRAQL
jgi:hypothetical protein